MSRKHVLTVVVLPTVFPRSAVRAAIGHAAAVTTRNPALASSVQQIVKACTLADAGEPAVISPATRRDEECAG